MSADLILFGGPIITVSDIHVEPEAVAVKDGKIMDIGKKTDILNLKGEATQVVDLEGQTLMPGLIEPHSHPDIIIPYGLRYVNVSGHTNRTPAEVFGKMKEGVKNTPKGEFVLIYGYDPIMVPGLKDLTMKDLDELSTEHPIHVTMQNGHTFFANSLAFKMAGINDDTQDPANGHYGRDSDGHLTGRADEIGAIVPLQSIIKPLEEQKLYGFIKEVIALYGKHGVTTVGSTGLFEVGFEYTDDVNFQVLVNKKDSPLRIVVYTRDLRAKAKGQDPDKIREGECGKNNYCVIGLKEWLDGSPYSGTIATYDSYLDTPLTRNTMSMKTFPWYGHLNHSYEGLFAILEPYHKNGLQLSLHAHGERAIDQGLDVYEALLKKHPRQDHRYRLEHCGLITKTQLKRAKDLGVSLSFYADHIHYYGRALRDDIFGPERAARWTPLKSATEAGHEWTIHSDSPCAPLGPFRMMSTALTRRIRDDVEGKYPKGETLGPEECATRDDVIRAVTINAAKQLFHEDYIGSIDIGKLADFVVLDKNPKTCGIDEFETIKVISIYKSGICHPQ